MNIYAPALVGGADSWKPTTGLPKQSELADIYRGLDVPIAKLYGKPTSADDLLINYVTSKLWRLNNLYYITDKDGKRVLFVMNKAQHRCYAAIMRWYRLIILKSRQQGISTFWLLCFLDDTLFYPDLNVGLMAQGREEASKLLRRVKLAWSGFDVDLKALLGPVGISLDNKNEIGFTNNSTIFISISFRSNVLQRLHVSELGKIANEHPERVRELRNGTLQTLKPGCVGVIESTADGDNDFRKMWDKAVSLDGDYGPKDFAPLFLSWLFDPDCVSYKPEVVLPETAKYFRAVEEELGVVMRDEQKWFWISQERELGEDIYQEYPSTASEAFIAVKDGTYYARLYMRHVILNKREVIGLYDEGLSVQVAMDIGYNDTFALIFFQKWGKEWRIIAEHYSSGNELSYYTDYIKNSGYSITNVEVPHDGEVTELQTGKTRIAFMRSQGIDYIHKVPSGPGVLLSGIDMVRRQLANIYIDPVACPKTVESFKTYTKERDEINEVWKPKPKKGKANHGMDAVRMMVMGLCEDSTPTRVELASSFRDVNVIDGIAM